MRLLVIDDDAQFLKAVTAFLTQRRHHVQGVASGKDGLALLQSQPENYEAVLLDIRMPGMSGLGLLRRLRRKHIQLPVVLVTGNADLPKVTEAVYLGIAGLVHKPFRPRQLEKVLEKLEHQHGSTAIPPPIAEEPGGRGVPQAYTPPWLQQIVLVMQAAVQAWTEQPKETLASLAEKSGLWSLTQDNATLRPRTLQKYLKLATLPKRPRLAPVLDTAEFVLKHCPRQTTATIDLGAKLEMLRYTSSALDKVPEFIKDGSS